MKSKSIIFLILLISIITLTSVTASSTIIYNIKADGNMSKYNITSNTTTQLTTSATIPNIYDMTANKNTGQYITIAGATADTDGQFTLNTSNDYGTTFINALSIDPAYSGSLGLGTTGTESVIGMSADGQYQYYAILYSLSSPIIRIYYSHDYGTTWTYSTIEVAGTTALGSLGVSPNGKYVGVNYDVGSSSEGLKVSSNYGVTWTYYSKAGNNLYYTSKRMYIDNNGQILETNEYRIDMQNDIRENYTTNFAGANIYYDYEDDDTLIIVGDGTGYKITGNISDASNYDAITDIGTNCYSLDGIVGTDEIFWSCNAISAISTNAGVSYTNTTVSIGIGFTGSIIIGNSTDIPSSTTTEYFDICLATTVTQTLCHHLYINDSVGVFCPITEQEICTWACSDLTAYYSSLGISPASQNYSGYCSSVIGGCNNPGQRSCITEIGVSTCLLDNSTGYPYYTFKATELCGLGYYCPIGQSNCVVKNVTTTPGTNVTTTDDFLSGKNLSDKEKLFIVVLIMIITVIAFGVIGFSTSYAQVGFIVGIVFGVFELILFTALGWVPAWILILLTLVSVLAGSMTLFINKGSRDG